MSMKQELVKIAEDIAILTTDINSLIAERDQKLKEFHAVFSLSTGPSVFDPTVADAILGQQQMPKPHRGRKPGSKNKSKVAPPDDGMGVAPPATTYTNPDDEWANT